MSRNGPKNIDMRFDRTAGYEGLELGTKPAKQRVAWEEPADAALIARAATCAVHGCCEDWEAEDAERWDGLG